MNAMHMKALTLSHRLTIAAVAVLSLFVFGSPLLAATAKRGGGIQLTAQDKLDKYWRNAKKEVDRSVLELLAQHEDEIARGLKFHKLLRGDGTKRQVALTFDDGPHPKYTPELLAILKQNHVKATFFLVGEMANKYPGLVRSEMNQGHAIGNHTYHHVNLTKIPIDDAATEIKACGQVLKKITGETIHLFRPPGGDYDKDVAEVAAALGYVMVLWTDDPGDYASPGAMTIENRLVDKTSNGGIILIHDGVQQTVDVLPQIIRHLKDKGYEFVTIDEMLKSQNPTSTIKIRNNAQQHPK
jgi:peptidoglycan-N-acetylglucosamine deacetylase